MGDNVYYGGKLPAEPYLVAIGDNVSIAMNVEFITHDIFGEMLSRSIFKEKVTASSYYEPIRVGNNVAIGGNVLILPGVCIGDNSIIAGGSVVTKNIEPGVVVGGNPARVLCTIEDFVDKRHKKNSPRWNWNDMISKIENYYWEKSFID